MKSKCPIPNTSPGPPSQLRLMLGAPLGVITPEDADRTVHRLQRWINDVNAFIAHAQAFLVHAFVPALKIAALAAFVIGLARFFGPRLRLWFRPVQWGVVRILPLAQSQYEPAAWLSFYRTLYGIAVPLWKRLLFGQPWLVFEYHSRGGRVTARCWFPRDLERFVQIALKMALPGVQLTPEADARTFPQIASARSRLALWRDALHPLGDDRGDALTTIVGALAEGREGLIQIALQPDVHWERLADRRYRQLSGEPSAHGFFADIAIGVLDFFVDLVFPRPTTPVSPQPRPWMTAPLPPRAKAMSPAWLADIRLCAWSDTIAEAKHALHAVAAAYRALDGWNALRPKKVRWAPGFDRALGERAAPSSKMHLGAEELAQLFHLPIGVLPMDAAPVRRRPDRELSVLGSVLCHLDAANGQAARIAQADRRHHVHVLGPTGSGKSTLLLNLALQDIEAGIGVGVLDPKGDLIRDVLERIPSRYADRLVLVDPSRRDYPVGLNVLACPDPSQREVVCDGIVAVFRKTYERFWGPRTDDVLRASVLTLLRDPEATLCEVPLLLLSQSVRARMTAKLDDPVGLKPFWMEYEQLSIGQRLEMIGPVLNKLRSFLLRPTVRNILGQSTSTIDLQQVIDGNGILLVSLAKGLLGEETSQLLGSFIVARLWQAALSRARHRQAERPDFNLYLDEFQNYLHLPQSLDDVLAEARAYRLNLTVANQHLGQLRESTRDALESNARTRVVFQCGQEDARHLARQFAPLTELDLQSLGRFQVAVRLCVDGHVEAPFTGITEAPPTSFGDLHAASLIKTSLSRYGRPVDAVESEIEARLVAAGVRGGFKELA